MEHELIGKQYIVSIEKHTMSYLIIFRALFLEDVLVAQNISPFEFKNVVTLYSTSYFSYGTWVLKLDLRVF